MAYFLQMGTWEEGRRIELGRGVGANLGLLEPELLSKDLPMVP
jgi:hypothetical protein